MISGWGYTEETKKILPRPLTSDVLREADVYILPQDLCIKYSPFPISDKMICTFKGPLGVETTCQGECSEPDIEIFTQESRVQETQVDPWWSMEERTSGLWLEQLVLVSLRVRDPILQCSQECQCSLTLSTQEWYPVLLKI